MESGLLGYLIGKEKPIAKPNIVTMDTCLTVSKIWTCLDRTCFGAGEFEEMEKRGYGNRS